MNLYNYFLFILTNNKMPFDIEDYLNSLPLSTTYINVSSKGLTYLPDLSRFKQLTELDCSKNQLTELPHLNDNLTVLYCQHNKLTWLPPLNYNLTHLFCSQNQLTGLPHLNDNLTHLYCSFNQLTELPPLNDNLIYLICSYNLLTWLPPLNDNLTHLYCSFNQLTSLPPLNHNLENLYCHYNKLNWLPPLNNKLRYLDCSNNNIYFNDLYDGKKINILRNFRYTYYLLKFKKNFKRWLWEKVREPKIIAKFHPSHLTHLLDSDDLEVFLEDWIKE